MTMKELIAELQRVEDIKVEREFIENGITYYTIVIKDVEDYDYDSIDYREYARPDLVEEFEERVLRFEDKLENLSIKFNYDSDIIANDM